MSFNKYAYEVAGQTRPHMITETVSFTNHLSWLAYSGVDVFLAPKLDGVIIHFELNNRLGGQPATLNLLFPIQHAKLFNWLFLQQSGLYRIFMQFFSFAPKIILKILGPSAHHLNHVDV